MKSISRTLCALLTALLFWSGAAQAGGFVSLGYVNLSFYEVTAALIQQVLERLGYNVGVTTGSHSQIYPKVASGDIDLFVAAWLPHTHKTYWDEYHDSLVKVGTLYEGAKLFWAVPDYVPASEVSSVADLAKPAVAKQMDPVIRGPGADSGLMIGSKQVFERYGLGAAGYQLAPGKATDWIDAFDRNIAERKWFVMPLWHPQYLNQVAKLRVLAEPDHLLGGTDTAYLVGNKDLRSRVNKYTWFVLSKIELSVKQVEEMDYLVNVKKMSPRDAARQWLASHPNTVTYWFEPPEE